MKHYAEHSLVGAPYPKNLYELSPTELCTVLAKGPTALTTEQKNKIVQYTILKEKSEHARVLFRWTTVHQFDWNQIVNGFTLLGNTIENNLQENARLLLQMPGILSLPRVYPNQCGIEPSGRQAISAATASAATLSIILEKEKMLQIIIESGHGDINAYFLPGEPPLIKAIKSPDPVYLRILSQHGDLQVNKKFCDELPFSLAMELGHLEHVQLLIEYPSFKINHTMPDEVEEAQQRQDRNSPLGQAIILGNERIVHQLLAYGANPREQVSIQDSDFSYEPYYMDMYHLNIYYAGFSFMPESPAVSMNRIKIGQHLLNTGIRPCSDSYLSCCLSSHLSRMCLGFENDPPLIKERQEQLRDQAHLTTRQLKDQLRVGVQSLQILSRGVVIDHLRTNSQSRTIVKDMKKLLATVNLPVVCSNFLQFI